jgi:hypothetical protein
MTEDPVRTAHPATATGAHRMHRQLTGPVTAILLAFQVQAADRITEEQIRQVIDATDTAAMNRDTAGIGAYLSDSFEKVIEFPYEKWMAKVKLDKDQYLGLIEEGWSTIEYYDYRRAATEIHIKPDGMRGMSYSTITEHIIQDGEEMTSKFREYATYELENGRPVITRISGHTLVGDTTPH